jgi:Cft2 family RNA processing exonuclease
MHVACYVYGAGQADEGVCLRLEIEQYRILLDCGLRDLSRLSPGDYAAIGQVDWVICSHAHPDHSRGLFAFHQAFPAVPIVASEATAALLPLHWPGAVIPADFVQVWPWRFLLQLNDRLSLELIPAGHLPGAAVIVLRYQADDRTEPYCVVYSGDCYLSNTRFSEGLRLAELRSLTPDVLILEGGYGVSRRPRRRQQENYLMERMAQALQAGQSILLPLPAIGLGQELLYLLRSHYLFSGRAGKIWVQGQVAAGCDAYLGLIAHFPIAVQNFARNQALFWDDKVQPTVYHGSPAADQTEPYIVLTDTRMELSQFCQQGKWLVLLPEEAKGKMNWRLDRPRTESDSQAIVTAETYSLSEHCDGNATLQLIHNLRPQHVVLIHGAPETLAEFADLDELSSRYKLHIPAAGAWIEFSTQNATFGGDEFEPDSLPEVRYEGEVAETQAEILISLPIAMAGDPRWARFADTGMVEAVWQGDRLVLRGMDAAELRQALADRWPRRADGCGNCDSYQDQLRCSNPASPLFQLQVTPEGYCGEFSPI